jgi:hypothetical protein
MQRIYAVEDFTRDEYERSVKRVLFKKETARRAFYDEICKLSNVSKCPNEYARVCALYILFC